MLPLGGQGHGRAFTAKNQGFLSATNKSHMASAMLSALAGLDSWLDFVST